MEDALVRVVDLCKVYNPGENEVRALDHVDLEIHKGEFVAIIGQSGSGKSTFMNMLGCLDVPTSGKYYLNGTDVSTMKDNDLSVVRNKEIGFIFSMSHSYCDTCNRVRLTSDGQMRLCLLRDDEADLVSLVRRGLSETELASHIEWALQRKQERHDGVTMDQPERPMWRIGG